LAIRIWDFEFVSDLGFRVSDFCGMHSPLVDIARVFLKIGTIGFGGPAAFYAMMEDEVVERRGWLSRQHYIDLIGATNLIPGPNATEVAMHVGYVHGGAAGLFVAGISFILPAALITSFLAWLYVQHVQPAQQPLIEQVIAGVEPAVLAIIFSAGWRLGKKAINGWIVGLVAIGVTVASLLNAPAIPVLLIGSAIGTIWLLWVRSSRAKDGQSIGRLLAGLCVGGSAAGVARVARAGSFGSLLAASAAAGSSVSLVKLGLFFLKVGLVLYGTGYVLFAYLESDVVGRYAWLEHDELLDAIAIGQFTPGPILSTATFIGYVVMAGDGNHALGLAGAAVATVCIFLPSFVLVAITNPIIPRLRRSRWTSAFLDAVNAASMGLIAAVTAKLAWRIFFPGGSWAAFNWQALIITVVACLVTLRWKVNAVWLVLGGAAAGVLFWLVGW